MASPWGGIYSHDLNSYISHREQVTPVQRDRATGSALLARGSQDAVAGSRLPGHHAAHEDTAVIGSEAWQSVGFWCAARLLSKTCCHGASLNLSPNGGALRLPMTLLQPGTLRFLNALSTARNCLYTDMHIGSHARAHSCPARGHTHALTPACIQLPCSHSHILPIMHTNSHFTHVHTHAQTPTATQMNLHAHRHAHTYVHALPQPRWVPFMPLSPPARVQRQVAERGAWKAIRVCE